MEAMAREAWTDERLDDLNTRVDSGLKGMRAEIREELQGVRGEMGQLRAEIGALNRTVIQFAWAVVGTIFLGFMGTIAALVTLV
jgi:predicted  nucleic acid-binding Zn-ribbon protein